MVSLTVQIELLDEGYVVGVPGGGRRRLAMNMAALPGKIGLAVADALGRVVQALGKATEATQGGLAPLAKDLPEIGPQGIGGTPIVSPPDAPKLDPEAPPGPPFATATAAAPAEAPPAASAAPEPEPEHGPPTLSKQDAERLDDVCGALSEGKVELSSDPDDPGFFTGALVTAGVFDDLSKASAWASRAFAAGELGRGSRTKAGYRYYVKRPIPVRTPPAPTATAPVAAEPPAHPAPPAPPAPPRAPEPATPVAAAPEAAPVGLPF